MVWSNGPVSPAFRCSVASARDDEPLAASSPTDRRWLLVEHAGPWGPQAVAQSRVPDVVRAHLTALGHDGVRVQLVRRHGSETSPGGPSVIAADLDPGPGEAPVVRRTVLDAVTDLLDLDPWSLPRSTGPVLAVCTNGTRDVCCAETGRPVAAALAARWPEATWETTHLGGHRFAGTLLALPAGVALGRLDAAGAVAAVGALLDGGLPAGLVRGRAGVPAAAQAAEHHVRTELGLDGLDDVQVLDLAGDVVRLRAAGRPVAVEVARELGPEQRHSCADTLVKATVRWRCRTLDAVPAPAGPPLDTR